MSKDEMIDLLQTMEERVARLDPPCPDTCPYNTENFPDDCPVECLEAEKPDERICSGHKPE